MTDQLSHLIKARLPLRQVPGLPEIRLHTAGPASGLGGLADAAKLNRSPYWAFQWAGGLALARYIEARTEIVRGKSVLDIGSGSGLVAIAAAKAGARAVVASDVDPAALTAIRLNAEVNAVVLEILRLDMATAAVPEVDLILAGDVFYDPEPARLAAAFFTRCQDAGVEILIGDPGRRHLPRHRLRKIAEFTVPDMGQGPNTEPSPSAVYIFVSPNALTQS